MSIEVIGIAVTGGLAVIGGAWAIGKVVLKKYVELLGVLEAIKLSIQEMRTGELRFTTTAGCLINNQRIEDRCEIANKATKDEVYIEMGVLEARVDKRIDGISGKIETLSAKLDKHMERAS